MSAPKPKLMPLADLPPGRQADFFAILLDRKRGITREGRPYFHCRFGDARRTVSFMAWSDDRWYAKAEKEWRPGQFYKLRGVYSEHERYGPQIELANLRPVREGDAADGFDPAPVEMSPQEPTLLMGELRSLVGASIAVEALRPRARLARPARRGVVAPARDARPGLSVSRRAARTHPRRDDHGPRPGRALRGPTRSTARPRPGLRRGGPARHRPRPGVRRRVAVPAVTIPGRLAGPHVLGRDLMRDAAREMGDIDAEWLALLEHLILTAGERGHGKGPMVPEGLILQHADELDLEMSLFALPGARRGAGAVHRPRPGAGASAAEAEEGFGRAGSLSPLPSR